MQKINNTRDNYEGTGNVMRGTHSKLIHHLVGVGVLIRLMVVRWAFVTEAEPA